MTTLTENLTIRSATSEDAADCGRIFFESFQDIAQRHSMPVEPASRDFTTFHSGRCIAHPNVHVVVAEQDGSVVGAATIDERDAISGIGPVVVDPAAQDAGTGRALMERLLARSAERGVPGVRLVQTAYHYRSFALYSRLGFATREPLSVVAGRVQVTGPAHVSVRAATADDLPACNAVCRSVHGHDRGGELADSIEAGSARVALVDGFISGYASGFGYGWHAVGRSNDELEALLANSDEFVGLGVLVPSRNTELLAWCLGAGLRIVQASTLMTVGLYNEPAGAWLPSILY